MRRTTVLAWTLAAISLAETALLLGMIAVPVRPGVVNAYPAPPVVAAVALFLTLTPVLGALIASRRPDNPAGWLFIGISLLMTFSLAPDSLGRRLPSSPALGLLVTLGSDLGSIWISLLVLLLILFPDGRLPSKRWRIVVALLVGATAVQTVTGLFAVGGGISPPIAGLEFPLARPDWQPVLDAIDTVAMVAMAAGLLSGLAVPVVRFRRSRGIERQQLKWFAWAGFLVGGILLVGIPVQVINAGVGDATWLVFLVSLLLLPIAATAAILRYRLFDIDLIIRRTLVYAALSAVLLLVYSASVLVLTQFMGPLTHGSSLAVAVSTLLVAALFSPARRRVQAVVDRRFYRQRYSAGREIARFGTSLRGEVDVERVEALLSTTVERTVQPAFASVWLKGTER